MDFLESTKLAQRTALEAALTLFHWKGEFDSGIVADAIIEGKPIRIYGGMHTGKSHIARLASKFGRISKEKRVLSFLLEINMPDDCDEYIEVWLTKAVSSKQMELCWRFMTALSCINDVLTHYHEINQ